MTTLTLAEVLVVSSHSLAVVDERPLGVQVCWRSVGQRPVVEMEQVAVVGLANGRATVQVRPAEELVLDLAGYAAGTVVLHLQLLVRVVVQTGVLSDFVLGHADARYLEETLSFAGFFAWNG